jgi:MFS family permease
VEEYRLERSKSETPPTISDHGWFRRIFVNRSIFYLWLGQIVSQSGDSIFQIGLLWILLELTGSKAQTGLVAMSAYLPTLLFGLYSGALVDRFDRRRLMLASAAARTAIVLIIPVLYLLGGLNGLVLGLVTFALATFNAVFNPARDALVGQLVEPGRRLQANSLIQTSWQYALFIGPGVAGIMLSMVGEIQLFSLDALTLLLSFYFIYRIKTPSATFQREGAKQLWERFAASWTDVARGLEHARGDRRVWALLLITAVDNLLLMGPAIVGLPIFVREVLHQGAESYALTQVAYAIGMITSTLLLNRFGRRWRHSHLLLWGIIIDGLTFLPLVWVKSFAGLFITTTIHALGIPLIIVARPTIVQQIVPDEMQGRVFSMISVAVYGLTAISIAITGAVAEVVPINIVFGIIAVLAASTGAVGWLFKDFREPSQMQSGT